MSDIYPAENPPRTPAAGVRKRHVFYFSGFDPRGPAHYHTLYGEQGKLHTPLNGLDLDVGKRRRVGKLANAWTVTAGDTETEYEFLRWDDIIRNRWPKNEWQLLKSAVPVYWVFLKANLVGRLLKIAWPSALTVSYPIIAFLGLLLTGAFLAVAAGIFLPLYLGLPLAAGILVGTIFLGRWLDDRFRSFWLLRVYGAMQPWAYGKMPELDERIREFADHIAERIKGSDADEILVVGHSVGTILTVPLVVELLKREPELGVRGPAFGLVSLGNCLPLVSLLPGSGKLREDLKTVATAPGVRWLDFSARRDGASVTQVDPLKVSGISRPEGIPVRPQQFPVRIVKMFPPDVYAVIKKDIFRIHFQYIMAGELLTDYDFFAITAGPMSLAERFPENAISPA
ncbi:MAG: hypothetical protein ABIS50_13840 [Luteolibacter sp.]|uniref:hypothetical protein n=1 Tax=Luteolibacter sp. TaxID=1962973 RepID=UPI003264058B